MYNIEQSRFDAEIRIYEPKEWSRYQLVRASKHKARPLPQGRLDEMLQFFDRAVGETGLLHRKMMLRVTLKQGGHRYQLYEPQ